MRFLDRNGEGQSFFALPLADIHRHTHRGRLYDPAQETRPGNPA
jgi:hypothetical protein